MKAGMRWFHFWASCFCWAFWRWERGEAMLRLLNPFATSYILWLLAVFGIVGIARETYWLTLVTLVPMFFIAILVAPYQLWKEQQSRADEAEAKLKPRISVNGTVVPGKQDKTACIRVTNQGSEPIRNCTGYLRAVFAVVDDRLEQDNTKPPIYLQWSPRSDGRGRQELTFNSEADLDVAVITSNETGQFQLAVFNDRLRDQYRLEERPSYVFEIEITAENCAAERHKYRLTINPTGLRAGQDSCGEVIPGPLPQLTFDVVNAS